MVIRNELIAYERELFREFGYEEIMTPIILSKKLWLQSGHWDHYKENMYFTQIDEEDYAVKPMNCPGGIYTIKRTSTLIGNYQNAWVNLGLYTAMNFMVRFMDYSVSVCSHRMMLIYS